jgi:hypothetical protein
VRFESVFAGFKFVGCFQREDLGWASFPQESKPFPRAWLPGPCYMFQLLVKSEFEAIATKVLPDRLTVAGATVRLAPKSWRDMAVLNMGNPIWSIDFVVREGRGRIWNRPDYSLLEQHSRNARKDYLEPDPRTDDYVLRLERG